MTSVKTITMTAAVRVSPTANPTRFLSDLAGAIGVAVNWAVGCVAVVVGCVAVVVDWVTVSDGDGIIVAVNVSVETATDSVGVATGVTEALTAEVAALNGVVAALVGSWAELMRKAWLIASTHRRREAMATC